jgi:hypothetical protein
MRSRRTIRNIRYSIVFVIFSVFSVRLAPERRLQDDDRRESRGAAKFWVCRLNHVAEVPLVRPANRIPRSIAPEACPDCGRRALCHASRPGIGTGSHYRCGLSRKGLAQLTGRLYFRREHEIS